MSTSDDTERTNVAHNQRASAVSTGSPEQPDTSDLRDAAFSVLHAGLRSANEAENVGGRVDVHHIRESDVLDGFRPEMILWKSRSIVELVGNIEIPSDDPQLHNRGDPPYDALRELVAIDSSGHIIRFRIWIEVAEAAPIAVHRQINRAIKDPDPRRTDAEIQRLLDQAPTAAEMEERAKLVVDLIQRKCEKGRDGGSYAANVKKWGRGLLVIGVPLWTAVLPHNLSEIEQLRASFVFHLAAGLDALRRTTLREETCPFDGVEIRWSPPKAAMKDWGSDPGSRDFADPRLVYRHYPVNLPELVTSDTLRAALSQGLYVRWSRHKSMKAFATDRSIYQATTSVARPISCQTAAQRLVQYMSNIIFGWTLKPYVQNMVTGYMPLARINEWPRLFRRWQQFCRLRRRYANHIRASNS